MHSKAHTPAWDRLATWQESDWFAASRKLLGESAAVQLKALQHFANMGDSMGDVQNFLIAHPGLMGFPFSDVPLAVQAVLIVDVRKEKKYGPEDNALFDEALRGGPFFRFRDQLRLVWGGGDTTGTILADLLSLFELAETNPDEEGTQITRRRWRVLPDWRLGALRYRPKNAFESACHHLLEKSGRAKVCARPDCDTPYFIAARATQRYCSIVCSDTMQNRWRKNWWEKHGNNWRKQRKIAAESRAKKRKR